jgi:hypothetical protein
VQGKFICDSCRSPPVVCDQGSARFEDIFVVVLVFFMLKTIYPTHKSVHSTMAVFIAKCSVNSILRNKRLRCRLRRGTQPSGNTEVAFRHSWIRIPFWKSQKMEHIILRLSYLEAILGWAISPVSVTSSNGEHGHLWNQSPEGDLTEDVRACSRRGSRDGVTAIGLPSGCACFPENRVFPLEIRKRATPHGGQNAFWREPSFFCL